ncbi:transglutaminase-like domain-containing protein [Hyperthermus butylicus]|uniref:Transglutaminase-like domain-containing protein n=1 Tax=Hyperthermus butylicus (strain DSM 5456 / JCM 9403 / PLM1-5) TaxID=415426 RepID=A2BKV9_HYPBU|nr:transglutaminase-like domain-containing protein [Hyperthermus butylicus]ABM80620.1 hypothetical protein Hbut_0766 [Hyperthermus butylicus DSM 5456]
MAGRAKLIAAFVALAVSLAYFASPDTVTSMIIDAARTVYELVQGLTGGGEAPAAQPSTAQPLQAPSSATVPPGTQEPSSEFTVRVEELKKLLEQLQLVPLVSEEASRLLSQLDSLVSAVESGTATPDEALERLGELEDASRLLASRVEEYVGEAVTKAEQVAEEARSLVAGNETMARVLEQVLSVLEEAVRTAREALAAGRHAEAYTAARQALEVAGMLEESLPLYQMALQLLSKAEQLASEARRVSSAALNASTWDALAAAEEAAAAAVEARARLLEALGSFPPNATLVEEAAGLLESASARLSEAEAMLSAEAPAVGEAVGTLERMLKQAKSRLAEAFRAVELVGDKGVKQYLEARLETIRQALSILEDYVARAEQLPPQQLAAAIHAAAAVAGDVEQVKLLATSWAAVLQTVKPRLYVNPANGWLVADVPGTIDAIAFYRANSPEPVLVVRAFNVEDTVAEIDPVMAQFSPLHSRLAVGLSELAGRLKPGRYLVVVAATDPATGELVEAYRGEIVVENEGSVTIARQLEGNPVFSPCSNVSPYRTAILCGYTPSTLAIISLEVYGAYKPTSSAEAAWRVLEWVGRSFTYDTSKAETVPTRIYTPLEMLSTRHGICSDYAVFTAAALLAGGVERAQVVVMPATNHAVAAVEAEGTLLLLDQHLPPIEPGDYVEYVAPKLKENPTVTVYNVEMQGGQTGIPVVTAWFDTRLSTLDTYPEDRLPDEVFTDAAERAAARLGMELNPVLKTVIEQGLAYHVKIVYGLWLGTVTSKPVPVTVYYTPILRSYWEEYITSILAETVEQGYPEAVEGQGSMAALHKIVVVGDGSGDAFYVYAVPLVGLRIDYSVKDGKAVLQVKPSGDISLLVYDAETKQPAAGVVRPGYMYTTIPYIEADEWTCTPAGCTIVFSLKELAQHLQPGRSYTLTVWINKHLVYAIPLQS